MNAQKTIKKIEQKMDGLMPDNKNKKIVIVRTSGKACSISTALGSPNHAIGLQDVQTAYHNISNDCCEVDVQKDGSKIDFGCSFNIKTKNGMSKKQILFEVETPDSYNLPHSLEQYLKSDAVVVSNMNGSCGIARTPFGEAALESMGIPNCDSVRMGDVVSRVQRAVELKMKY